jgi:hypothetical protein
MEESVRKCAYNLQAVGLKYQALFSLQPHSESCNVFYHIEDSYRKGEKSEEARPRDYSEYKHC